jgi:ClpP class serine protease
VIPRRAKYVPTGFIALDPKAYGQEFVALASGVPTPPYEDVGTAAVVDICGPLEQRSNWLWDSYEDIRPRAQAAFDSALPAVVLKINSGGGAACGCVELARALRAMAEESGKPLYTYVDGLAASAAFVIACAATAGIYAMPTSTVGSISVYEAVPDISAQDALLGLSIKFIPATGADLKLVGNPHLPLSDAGAAHVQANVDVLANLVYEAVSDLRGISIDDIKALKGATQLGVSANNLLVDGLVDWPAFLAGLDSPEGPSMGAQAKSVSYDEALAALLETSKGDDDKAAKAKKMLSALLAEDESPSEDDKDKEKKDKEAAAAKAEEEEKDKEAKAQASATAVSLAQELHALKAKIAAKEESEARAALLAQRPDFSAEVRKTLASTSLETLEHAVKTWPRIGASPSSSAKASTVSVRPERKGKAATNAELTPAQQAILDKVYGRSQGAKAAVYHPNGEVEVGIFDPEAAEARLAELAAMAREEVAQ